jgi:hypothetical protein
MALAGLLALTASLLIPVPARAQSFPAPVLQWDQADKANAGYYRLSWHLPEGTLKEGVEVEYELQASDNGDFRDARVAYRGWDTARVISGQHNGVTYYRVRVQEDGQTSPWSEVVAATVEHFTLIRAFEFFTVGALVFIITLAFVIVASHRAKQKAGAHG